MMTELERVSVLAKFHILAPIRFDVAGVETSWTSFVVKVAVIPSGTALVSGDLITASTETDTTTTPSTRLAKLLIGPGAASGVVLTAGFYDVYTQVAETTETPVLFHGSFEAY